MNNSKTNVLNRLNIEAHNGKVNQQLAAGILKNSKLITKPCCNIPRNKCRGAFIGSLHAEANAIINYFGKFLSYDGKNWRCSKRNNKLDLVVIRINKSGEICNARPCYNCLNMMKCVGIKKVYYSINSEEILCENVKDMISIQSSSVNRAIDKVFDNNIYYEKLLKTMFPTIVRKNNLDIFIKYNLSTILPNHKVIEENYFVIILDNNNNIITKAIILY